MTSDSDRPHRQAALESGQVRSHLEALREAHDRLERAELFESTGELLRYAAGVDGQGHWEYDGPKDQLKLSSGWLSLLGYERGELEPRLDTLYALCHPDDAPRLRALLESLLNAPKHDRYELEHRLRTKSGNWRWVLARGRVLQRDNAARAVRAAGSVIDITARVAAEQELRASEARYRALYEHSPVGVATANLVDHRLQNVNPTLCAMLGYSEEELLRKTVEDITHPDDRHVDEELARRGLLQAQERAPLEKRFVRKDGTVLWAAVTTSLLYSPTGQAEAAIGVVVDISDRKRAEESLRYHQDLLSATGDTALVGGWEIDLETDRVFWTHATRLIHEVPPDYEPTVAEAIEFYDEESRPVITHAVQEARATGRPFDRELRLITASGQPRWARAIGKPEFRDGVCTKLWGTFQDITERKEAEIALRESNRRLSEILESIRDGFFALNQDLVVTYTNSAAEKILGRPRSEVLGRALTEAFPEARGSVFEEKYRSALRERKPVNFETYFESPPYTNWYEVSVYPYEEGISVFFQVITERKRMEEQLRHSQKMEAVGRLAGGVAHDFNNLLTAILGNLDLLRHRVTPHLEEDDLLREGLDQIQRASERAASLTRQLLTFSRRQLVRPQVLDPNRAIENVEQLLRRLMPENVYVETDYAAEAWPVRVDAAQFEQVVMNLALNARDAMPDGGTLLLRTRNVTLTPEQVSTIPEANAGPHVEVTVKDTGCGMDGDTLHHAFEPFFTTKSAGAGTGLGLATVHGIVHQARGHVLVDSVPEGGSTFSIYLPAVVANNVTPAPNEADAPARGGCETILVCEDDSAVRQLTCRALETRGYRVLAATDAENALEVARACDEKIDLLVTDVIMPGMNGRELALLLTQERPDLEVLYVSGYTADVIGQSGLVEKDIELLSKPFSARVLAKTVRRILDT